MSQLADGAATPMRLRFLPIAAQLLRTRPTPCCFFTSRGVGKKRPCRGQRVDAGGRGRWVVCMAALIRTWLLFLHAGRGRLNEPLGVDYDTCAKPMNRLRMVVGARLTNWKGDGGELLQGASVSRVLHALHVDSSFPLCSIHILRRWNSYAKRGEKFSAPSPFPPRRAASLLIAPIAPLFRPIRQTRRTSSPSDGRCRFT